MSDTRRIKKIARLREEGRQAYRDGKHIQTNPYKSTDADQWARGYREEADFVEREDAELRREELSK